MRLIKDAWADPVGSNVIAGVILAAIAAVAAVWWDWWPTIWSALILATVSLADQASAPVWLLGLGAIVMLLAVTGGAIEFVRRARINAVPMINAGAGSPAWANYTEGIINSLNWRWRYSGDHVIDLTAFCPDCDLQLRPYSVSVFLEPSEVWCNCSCGFSAGPYREPLERFHVPVRHAIEKEMRKLTAENRVVSSD